jgi:hypothetical protein
MLGSEAKHYAIGKTMGSNLRKGKLGAFSPKIAF